MSFGPCAPAAGCWRTKILVLGCARADDQTTEKTMLLLEPFVEGRFTKWIKNTGDILKVPRAKHHPC